MSALLLVAALVAYSRALRSARARVVQRAVVAQPADLCAATSETGWVGMQRVVAELEIARMWAHEARH